MEPDTAASVQRRRWLHLVSAVLVVVSIGLVPAYAQDDSGAAASAPSTAFLRFILRGEFVHGSVWFTRPVGFVDETGEVVPAAMLGQAIEAGLTGTLWQDNFGCEANTYPNPCSTTVRVPADYSEIYLAFYPTLSSLCKWPVRAQGGICNARQSVMSAVVKHEAPVEGVRKGHVDAALTCTVQVDENGADIDVMWRSGRTTYCWQETEKPVSPETMWVWEVADFPNIKPPPTLMPINLKCDQLPARDENANKVG